MTQKIARRPRLFRRQPCPELLENLQALDVGDSLNDTDWQRVEAAVA